MTDGVHTTSKDSKSEFVYPGNLKKFVFSLCTKSEYFAYVYDTGCLRTKI
jgi:hypothetical protein